MARRSIIPVFVPHLGCPHQCVFCDQRRISGTVKAPTGDDVRSIIREGISVTPGAVGRTVAFYGGSFTAIDVNLQEELLGAAHEFIELGEVTDLRVSTRPDCIDDDTLARLKRYGVCTVELGVQSMDSEVLRLSGRGHTAEDAEKASELVKNAGFTLILQMMTGLPGDTRERTLETARRLIALRPHGVRIYPTVVIENTPLHDLYLAGSYSEHTVEDAAEWGADLLDMFSEAGIDVIRFGLNPTEELSGGAAAAGAYHPALREIAESRRYRRAMEAELTSRDEGRAVIFAVRRGKLSQALGQKRENVKYLKSKFGLEDVFIREADIDAGVVRVSR